MAEQKFEITRISLDGGKTWRDVEPGQFVMPSKILNKEFEVKATGGHGDPVHIPIAGEVTE